MIWRLTHAIPSDNYGMAFDFMPLDGDIQKVRIKDLTIDIGINPINSVHHFRCGRTLDTTLLPARLKPKYDRGGGDAAKNALKVPDLFGVDLAQVVSEKFKSIVESMDPGAHQFYPVQIAWKNNPAEPLTYYWFAPGQRLFAFDHQRTSPPVSPVTGQFMHNTPLEQWAPAFRQDVVADHSLFSAAEFPGAIFIIDQLKGALEQAQLKGLIFIGPYALS